MSGAQDDHLLEALIGLQKAVAEKFDRVDARFDRFERDMNRRFDLVDDRFDRLEPKRKRPRDRE